MNIKGSRSLTCKPPTTEQSSTVEYEIVKCGAAGHTLRGAMSSSSSPLGLVPAGTTLLISRTVSQTFMVPPGLLLCHVCCLNSKFRSTFKMNKEYYLDLSVYM